MSKEFKLSRSLYGHSKDIRSVACTSNNDIISGSRDRTAKFWKFIPLQNVYNEVMTYKTHENFVGSVLYLEPTTDFPDGLVVTGGYDKAIYVYRPGEPFPTFSLKGVHANTVCALSRGNSPNSFLSASWDHTAKYWDVSSTATKPTVTFSGHEASVWHVRQLGNNQVVTGSADKTIGVWTPQGQRVHVLKGHTDAVRCIEDFPELNRFYSVSNDATIRVWTYEGENLATYYGHNSFIYSIARCKALGDDSFVTSDEDRTVRIWKNGENVQIINLPALSVWCVTCLPNGDVVSGSSDGVVRIFTQDEGRVADEATLKRFEEESNAVKSQALKEIGGYKVSDLPGKEALFDPGRSAGQIKMIRENGGVMAYSWVEEGDTGHWEKIGDVMGGVENKEGEKKKYEGKEYDFVFSVDVEDGKPPLKLPFNKGDDPYVAAHAFLEKHFLPADYLEQVVDFILKNSNEQYVPKLTAEYQDPFTGASRHTPSYGQNQAQTAALDPFTGANAYTTSKPSEAASNSLSSNSNSLNQGSRSSGFFPQTSYRSFDMGDPGVILNKLKEFNQKCGDGSQRVDDRQLEEMVKVANGLPSDPNAFDTLFKLLDWPDDIIFPVLDVVRLAVKHKKNNEVIVSMNNGIIVEKLKHYTNGCCKVTSNIIVSLRTLSNLCLHEPGELLVYNNRFELFENFTSLSELTKAGQVALATCLLNVTIMTGKQKDELGFSVLAQVLPDILSRLTDPEAQFRLYVAVGTLIKTAQLHGAAVKAKLNENSNFLSTMQSHSFSGQNELENKRMNCVKQLSALL